MTTKAVISLLGLSALRISEISKNTMVSFVICVDCYTSLSFRYREKKTLCLTIVKKIKWFILQNINISVKA